MTVLRSGAIALLVVLLCGCVAQKEYVDLPSRHRDPRLEDLNRRLCTEKGGTWNSEQQVCIR